MDCPYWECTQCRTTNMAQFVRCVSCDTPQPKFAAVAASPQRQDISRQGVGANSSPSAFLPRQINSPQQLVRPASPQPTPQNSPIPVPHPSASPAQRLGSRISAPPFSPPQPTSAVDHEQFDNIRRQLSNAVQAHRSLLHQYEQQQIDIDQLRSEVIRLQGELASVSSTLRDESGRRQKDREFFARGDEAKDKTIAGLRDRVSVLVSERDEMLDRIQNSAQRQFHAKLENECGLASLVAQKETEVQKMRQELLEADVRRREALEAVVSITAEAEALRKTISDTKVKHAGELHRVMEDAMKSNESSIAALTSELKRGSESAAVAAQRERDQLRLQVEERQKALDDQREANKTSVEKLESRIRELQQLAAAANGQRDELAAEAKFQIELFNEQKTEAVKLRVENAALRAALAGFEGKARNDAGSVALMARPSLANVSHNPNEDGACTKLVSPPNVPLFAEIVDMEKKVQALRSPPPPTAPTVPQPAQTASTVQPTEVSLESIKELQSQQDTIAQLREKVAALEKRCEHDASDSVTHKSAADRLAQENKHLEEAIEDATSNVQLATFEANELKKQLAQAKEQLHNRDLDLEESARQIADVQRSLDAERNLSKIARGDLDKVESSLREQIQQWKAQVESLNRQVTDLTEQNVALREKSSATDEAMKDMEQTMADLLAVVAEAQSGGSDHVITLPKKPIQNGSSSVVDEGAMAA